MADSKIECLKSLSFPDQIGRFDEIHTASDTCGWLLKHRSWLDWITASSGHLWIEGSPGVGKSVLMKYILQNLKTGGSRNRELLIYFFVHGQGSDLQKSKLGLLRSILHQLLSRIPDLVHIIFPTYSERSRTMEIWQWAEGELQSYLTLCLELAYRSHSIILLVDALDELGEPVALEVVNHFRHLAASPLVNSVGLRICFSCRHYPAISLDEGYHICVEKENSGDIRQVVSSILSGVDESDDLLSLITGNAMGVFQWAVLVSKEARDLSRKKMMSSYIHRKIQELPKTLHQLYLGLLEDSSPTTLRFFQWVCFAPVSLSPAQLHQALAVSIEESYQTLDEYVENLGFQETPDGLISMVKTLSKGLARITEHSMTADISNERVVLIHQSVRDFLMQRGFQYLQPSLSIHAELFSKRYLSEQCFKFLQVISRNSSITSAADQHRLQGLFAKHIKQFWQTYVLQSKGYGSVFEMYPSYQYSTRAVQIFPSGTYTSALDEYRDRLTQLRSTLGSLLVSREEK